MTFQHLLLATSPWGIFRGMCSTFRNSRATPAWFWPPSAAAHRVSFSFTVSSVQSVLVPERNTEKGAWAPPSASMVEEPFCNTPRFLLLFTSVKGVSFLICSSLLSSSFLASRMLCDRAEVFLAPICSSHLLFLSPSLGSFVAYCPGSLPALPLLLLADLALSGLIWPLTLSA